MIGIEISKVELAIGNHKKYFDAQIDKAKTAINNFDNEYDLDDEERQFLKVINSNITQIVYAKPNRLDAINSIVGVLPNEMYPNRHKWFKDRVIKALGYERLRSEFFPIFFNELGIKCCVYCNSQLAIGAKKDSGEIVGKYQLDHYWPKADYPHLSISPFNLYPVCASCNLIKGKKMVDFQLYESKVTPSKFHFQLEKDVKAKFLTSKNIDDIKFTFIESSIRSGYDSFNDTFHIQGIYDTQRDVIEELIYKSQVYNSTYKRILTAAFPGIFTSASINNRLILGNYHNSKDIHKRPMAKFTQDIARALKLIPEEK